MLKLINTQKIDNITKIAIILFIICFNINFMFSFKQYQTILLLSSLLFFFINKPISSGFLIIWVMSILISKNLKKKEKFINEQSNSKENSKENKDKYLKEIKKYLKQYKDFEIDKDYNDFIDKLELVDNNNNNNNNNNDIIKYIKINLQQNEFLSPKYEKSNNNNNNNEIWYFNNLENLNTNYTNYIKGDTGDYIHTKVLFNNNKNLKQIIKEKYTNYKINPIPTKTTKIFNLKPLQPTNTNDEKSDEPLVNKLPDDVLNIQELDKIVIDFSKVFNEVIDEITNELNTTKKPTDIKDKWTMISYIIDFIKKLFLILTKKGRMFHVGILMFCVSIVLFFI